MSDETLNWVRVTDDLPPVGEYVLWYTERGHYFVERVSNFWTRPQMGKVTHWARFKGPST